MYISLHIHTYIYIDMLSILLNLCNTKHPKSFEKNGGFHIGSITCREGILLFRIQGAEGSFVKPWAADRWNKKWMVSITCDTFFFLHSTFYDVFFQSGWTFFLLSTFLWCFHNTFFLISILIFYEWYPSAPADLWILFPLSLEAWSQRTEPLSSVIERVIPVWISAYFVFFSKPSGKLR